MRWDLATKKQLITIMNYDRECPKELLRGAVNEMLERGILKDWIMYLSKRFFGTVRSREIKVWLEDLDIIQLGYIGLLKALDKYEEGKSAFSTFSRYYIFSEWQNHFRKFNSEKRTMDRDCISSDLEVNEEGDTLYDLLPSYENVEKTVLMRVYFESQVNKLSTMQKTAIFGYMKGYDMKEIAKQVGSPRQSIERAFHRAVEKMGGEKMSLKENSGLKGA